MWQKLLQSISGNTVLSYFLKVLFWVIVLVAIIVTMMLMNGEEITYVYDGF